MNDFNLSDWALRHRSLVWYAILICVIAGTMAYTKLGREEDPPFSIKTMIIQARWPGASIDETTNQVTDRIEKKLQELASLDYTRSITTPGETTIFVNLKDTTQASEVPQTWIRVRSMIGDIRGLMPSDVIGPLFNDTFGDFFGNVYAFTADGLTDRQLRDYVEDVRSTLLKLPQAGKIELIGEQGEAIYLEFSSRELASFGIDQQSVIQSLQAQNAISPSGVMQAGQERISLRVGGQFASEEALRAVNLRINDRFFRLSDIAKVSRRSVDPPSSLFRFNGKPAIGLAIGMRPGSNLLVFGEALHKEIRRIEADLPAGIDVHLVSDQPRVVEEAINGFTRALVEAVAIVLIVSFVSLGFRPGLVVALAIPLVLAVTFVVMDYYGIYLQRISLGALIIALGLLVDDAMIAVEMMVTRLEAGDPLEKAATYVYSSTAFPMLTGTLVTVAGFIPVGLNGSSAGEFTHTLFVVIAAALLISWAVAVLFTPLLGVTILPKSLPHHDAKPGRFRILFTRVLLATMRARWLTIGISVALFVGSVVGLKSVQQQFFPASDRTELIVDWTLPQNASIADTKSQMDRFEETILKGDPDIERWSSYVGRGAVRFLLSFDVQPSSPFFGQTVIVTKDLVARERVKARIEDRLRKEFVGTDAFVKTLELGPPVGRPVQYRVSGPSVQRVRELSLSLASIVATNPRLGEITYDWNEPGRVVKVHVLHDKARQLGVSSSDISTALNGLVGGAAITQVRDNLYLIDVVARARQDERTSIATLQDLQLPTKNGKSVPIAAVATIRYELEQPVIWRRDRSPTITLKAAITDDTQPGTVVGQLQPAVDGFIKKLPPGYTVTPGGTVEDSGRGQRPIVAVVPLMLFAITTILMIQLQSFQRLFLVVAVAPLGLIGVVAALLIGRAPMGFVAILGVLALVGILIRNSVILVVQIEHLRAEGKEPWDAVVEATEHRMRPIILTAAAASLGLIPIASEVFWGPMAFAMIGGIVSGTALTLLFLPALYVAWFRIKAPDAADTQSLEIQAMR